MKRLSWILLAAALVGTTSWADMDWTREVGFRAGVNDGDHDAFLREYEVYGTYRTPWQGGKEIVSALTVIGSAGVLDGEDATAVMVAVGPGFVIGHPRGRFSVDGGSKVTYLSEHHFGGLNLGGPLEFTSHIGARFDLAKGWGLSYRFQHISNAGIYIPNPGVEVHLVGLSCRY